MIKKKLLPAIFLAFAAVYSYADNAPEDITKAAESGDASAQFTLGEMYYLGENGVSQDYKKARVLLVKAEKQGHADAAALLGLMDAKGEGGKQDMVAAEKYFAVSCKRGSEQGCEFNRFLQSQKK